MKRYSRNLVIVFLVTAAVSMAILQFLNERYHVPLHGEPIPLNYLVAISIYNGYALAGLLVMHRFVKNDRPFLERSVLLIAVIVACILIRAPILGTPLEWDLLLASVLWETARAVCVAFAVAYIGHALMVRYLPTTLLRVRDITPVLNEGMSTDAHRLRHARRSRWIFDLASRDYFDTTGLELRTSRELDFNGRSWAEVTFWTSMVIFALSIYIEAYPRSEATFDLILTAVLTGYLLGIVPVLLLPVLPIEALGGVIPVNGKLFNLSRGYRVTAYRWAKVAFFPIIAVGLLFRAMPWENAMDLVGVVLVSVPTAALTLMIYMDLFRKNTVAEIHREIPRRERMEMDRYGKEPWRERSLMEGVRVVEGDIYLE